MSLTEAAAAIGITRVTLHRFETGDPISGRMLVIILRWALQTE